MELSVPRSPLASREDLLVVELDRFHGPLDLLLHLIRQQDLDIFKIPIAKITDQFLAAIEGIEAEQLEGAGEFLDMAATLVRIKAQMLLPRHEDGADEDPRAELVRRLLEYELIREVANRLQWAESERARRFGKGFVPARPRAAWADTPLETTWEDVFQAALAVEAPETTQRRYPLGARRASMEEKILLITRALGKDARIEFSRLLRGFEEKVHAVLTLLAGLEMSRRRELSLRQVTPFGELWLYRRTDDDGPPSAQDATDTA